MRTRHKQPTLVSMWMLDVFCCTLGCVTLLWLLKTREAAFSAMESAQAATALVKTREDLEKTKSDLEAETRTKLAALDESGKLARWIEDLEGKIALLKVERDEQNLEKTRLLGLIKKKEDELRVARSQIAEANTLSTELKDQLAKKNNDLNSKANEIADLTKKTELAEKKLLDLQRKAEDLDTLVRNAQKAKDDAEARARAANLKLEDLSKTMTDASKLQARITELEAQVRNSQTKIEDANAQIIDLQGQKAKLADKINKLQIESDNKFAGIALTGKNVVFMVDMSGSMDRVDENTIEPTKWPTVRDTLIKIMRSLPDLEKFQILLFSGKVMYLLESNDWMIYEKEKSLEKVHKAMSLVRPTGDTNLYAAFEEAFKYRAKGMDTVYLISDGLPTSGPGITDAQAKLNLKETERSELLARHLRRTLNNSWNRPEPKFPRVRINCIGFFYESPDLGAFLWTLAREHDGSFVGMSKP